MVSKYHEGQTILHQGVPMRIVGTYCKLGRWFYDLVDTRYHHSYTTAERFIYDYHR